MNYEANKKALRAAIRSYRARVKFLENNLGERVSQERGDLYINGSRLKNGSDDCALCKLYFYSTPRCLGCCISESTGKTYCGGTPYGEFCRALYKSRRVTKRLINATKKELEFLEDLLEQLKSKSCMIKGSG